MFRNENNGRMGEVFKLSPNDFSSLLTIRANCYFSIEHFQMFYSDFVLFSKL